MSRTTKAEKQQSIESLKEALTHCGPNGKGTLTITWAGGQPTSTGRSDYYEVRIVLPHSGDNRPIRQHWLNWNMAKALGYRLCEERLSVGGCGYSKTHALADALAHLAGFELTVDLDGSSQRTVKP